MVYPAKIVALTIGAVFHVAFIVEIVIELGDIDQLCSDAEITERSGLPADKTA
jgi:hypothetical protein